MPTANMTTLFGVKASFCTQLPLATEALSRALFVGVDARQVGLAIPRNHQGVADAYLRSLQDGDQRQMATTLLDLGEAGWEETLVRLPAGLPEDSPDSPWTTQKDPESVAIDLADIARDSRLIFGWDTRKASEALLRFAFRAAFGSPASLFEMRRLQESGSFLNSTAAAYLDPRGILLQPAAALGYQERMRLVQGDYYFAVLVPEVVRAMRVREQVAVTVQYLRELERLVQTTLDALANLTPGEREREIQVVEEYLTTTARWRRFRPPFHPDEAGEEERWIQALFSSAIQVDTVMNTRLSALMHGQSAEAREKTLAELQHLSHLLEEKVIGKHRFVIRRVLREVAQVVLQWLDQNFPLQRWEEDGLSFINTTGPLFTRDPAMPYFRPVWRSDLQTGDLWRYLEMLEWRGKVERRPIPSGRGVETVVHIDFGDTLRATEEPESWMRTSKGHFEWRAMRPEDLKMLSEEEKLELVKQLVEESLDVARRREIAIHALEAGDVEGLQRQRETLKMETEHLLSLFPAMEEESLDALVKDLRVSAEYPLDVMYLSIGIALTQLELGESWNKVIKMIVPPYQEVEQLSPDGEHGFRLMRNKWLLARNVMSWLRALPMAGETWSDNSWTFGIRNEDGPENHSAALITSSLRYVGSPLNGAMDPILWNYLEVLGNWSLLTLETGTYTVAQLNFGRTGFKTTTPPSPPTPS